MDEETVLYKRLKKLYELFLPLYCDIIRLILTLVTIYGDKIVLFLGIIYIRVFKKDTGDIMFPKLVSLMKNLLFLSIPGIDKKEFDCSINRLNITRAKITSITFIILELFVMTASLVVKKERNFSSPGIYYLVMYIVMIAVMAIFLLIFIQLGKNIHDNRIKIWTAGIIFAIFILIWCAGISLLDQISNNQIIVYMVAIICVAITPLYHPIILFMIFATVHSIFLIAFPIFHTSDHTWFSSYVNSTTILIMSWIISYMRYKSQIEDYKMRKHMEDNTKELGRVNSELEEANKKLEILSQIDSLTGIYNRSMFDQIINREWDNCKRAKKCISLIMVDIDFFKAYNDNYGHQAGDDCLKTVAAIMADCAKSYLGTVTRYGGEEFAIILSGFGKDKVQELAETMRAKVEERQLLHPYSSISDYVTISLGVYTVIPSDHISIKNFIRTSDKALYKAKNQERNKVVVA